MVIKDIDYKKFGKCIEVTNNNYRLILTTEFGPRIIFFSTLNGKNILFEDANDKFTMSSDKFDEGDKWHSYGGHRLWVSPENILTYDPDNNQVHITVRKNYIQILSQVSPLTGLEKTMVISFFDDYIKIEHFILNMNNKPVELAPWCITQMVDNGLAIFKFNDKDTGFLPNHKLVCWPYTNLGDGRLILGKYYMGLKHNPKINESIKLGMDNECKKIVYIKDNLKFTIEHEYLNDVTYPDGGCSIETFANDSFVELEILGELTKVKAHKDVKLNEIWRIKEINNSFNKNKVDEKTLKEFWKI